MAWPSQVALINIPDCHQKGRLIDKREDVSAGITIATNCAPSDASFHLSVWMLGQKGFDTEASNLMKLARLCSKINAVAVLMYGVVKIAKHETLLKYEGNYGALSIYKYTCFSH